MSKSLQVRLAEDTSSWGLRRKAAFLGCAGEAISDLTRRDAAGVILNGLAKGELDARKQVKVLNRALDTLRREVAPDQEKVAGLEGMRDFLQWGIAFNTQCFSEPLNSGH
ncbi:MAG: hypothetical protein IPN59_16900 [Holophaga sp.]|nr:hypothetical protein [Holophaga sp.]